MKLLKQYSLPLTLLAMFMPAMSQAADTVVNAEARVFNPAIVYIELGDTVRWTNMTSHNAVSYVVPEGSKGFGTKGELPGGSFSATPDKEGIYGYVCEPHVGFGMVGVIVVGPVTQEMKDAAKKKAMETLEGPFKRVIGKINKIEVK
jgi:pseudoazurin